MKVTLIEYTGSGYEDPAHHAAAVLIFTKNTRLNMSPGAFQKTLNMSWEEKLKELEYMANTIPSSWEFVDYTFMIEGVTRAFTHQLVRTRTASYAQQTMRTLDMSEGFEYTTGPSIKENYHAELVYSHTMHLIKIGYQTMVEDGVKPEDARGILPTNILTNIVMKINMRNFVELVRKRSSSRVQGEYREVVEAMIEAVKERHPFISLFLERTSDKAAKELDTELSAIPNDETRMRLLKLLYQVVANK